MQATIDNPIPGRVPRRVRRSAVRPRRLERARTILSALGCALLAGFDFYSR